ncbi:MAG: hypothetical protein B7Z71_06650 [Acidocella sp. 21-58-7]|nr:MAG: hypothetical protein B7Z71_06650 [Acidocella sp. 21-58-7]HQT65525.1 DUF6118 family protein [Acidocella sp.]
MGGGLDDEDQAGDPTQAFEDLRAEVAALIRTVSALPRALAENRQPAPPDYRSDIGKVAKELNALVGRLDVIEKHPAMRLTPEQHQQAVARAGNELMSAAAGNLNTATGDYELARGQLAGMIGTMRGKKDQAFWLIVLPIATLIVTLLVSPVLLSELPFGWNTNAAATVMKADRWDAGWFLLGAADPAGKQDAAVGFNLVQVNRAALATCQQAAAREGRDQHCMVIVRGQY